MSTTKKSIVIDQKGQSDSSVKRRAFLKYSGVSIATSAFILSGCEDVALTPDRNKNAAARAAGEGEVDLGSGDIGILNYAYALEQLEAAFYTTVVASSGFASMYTEEERMILKDLKDHEIVHREFFRTALGEN